SGRGAGLDVLGQPCLIRVVAVNAHIAVRSIEKVAYRIGFCIDRSDRPDPRDWIRNFLGRRSWSSAQPGSRYPLTLVNSGPDLRFMIRDPRPNFEFHHLAFAVRTIEVIRGGQYIGSFLVVVKEKMATHCRDHCRKANSQAPACDVDFMDRLIADFAVARIPNPMPVVVKTILSEWLQRCRSSPEVVVNTGRYCLLGGMTNSAAPLVTQRAPQINITNYALAKALNGLDHSRIRT